MKRTLSLLLILALLACASGCAKETPPAAATAPVTEELTTAPATDAPASTEAPTRETAPADTETPANTEVPPETEAPTESAPPETETPEPAATTQTEPPEESTDFIPEREPSHLEVWELIDDDFFEEGTFTDEYGYDYTYSYELPKFTLETPTTKAINADIQATFGANAQEALDWIERRVAPGILGIGFFTSAWENVVALVLVEHTDWGFDDYRVYCYDAENDAWLTTAQLVEKMGYTQEQFLEAAKMVNLRAYEEQYELLDEDMRQQTGYYDFLPKATSERYINMDLMAYPDAYGDLIILAPVPSLAGADYYYQQLYLELAGVG